MVAAKGMLSMKAERMVDIQMMMVRMMKRLPLEISPM